MKQANQLPREIKTPTSEDNFARALRGEMVGACYNLLKTASVHSTEKKINDAALRTLTDKFHLVMDLDEQNFIVNKLIGSYRGLDYYCQDRQTVLQKLANALAAIYSSVKDIDVRKNIFSVLTGAPYQQGEPAALLTVYVTEKDANSREAILAYWLNWLEKLEKSPSSADENIKSMYSIFMETNRDARILDAMYNALMKIGSGAGEPRLETDKDFDNFHGRLFSSDAKDVLVDIFFASEDAFQCQKLKSLFEKSKSEHFEEPIDDLCEMIPRVSSECRTNILRHFLCKYRDDGRDGRRWVGVEVNIQILFSMIPEVTEYHLKQYMVEKFVSLSLTIFDERSHYSSWHGWLHRFFKTQNSELQKIADRCVIANLSSENFQGKCQELQVKSAAMWSLGDRFSDFDNEMKAQALHSLSGQLLGNFDYVRKFAIKHLTEIFKKDPGSRGLLHQMVFDCIEERLLSEDVSNRIVGIENLFSAIELFPDIIEFHQKKVVECAKGSKEVGGDKVRESLIKSMNKLFDESGSHLFELRELFAHPISINSIIQELLFEILLEILSSKEKNWQDETAEIQVKKDAILVLRKMYSKISDLEVNPKTQELIDASLDDKYLDKNLGEAAYETHLFIRNVLKQKKEAIERAASQPVCFAYSSEAPQSVVGKVEEPKKPKRPGRHGRHGSRKQKGGH